MHFSIPDTLQVTDDEGKKYWMFNINVNGVFHCSLRYSQLDKLHEQLRRDFPSRVPSKLFPGKKLFALSPEQLEERRDMLEKFIQAVSQDSDIVGSDTFINFFLKAQQETRKAEPEEIEMKLYLMNGNSIDLNLNSLDQADEVLEAAMQKIGLPDKFVYYFGLYLVAQDDENNVVIVRRLQDFESPYLSLKAVKDPHRVVIRKSYWNAKYDEALMKDRTALNLLYVQAVDDLSRGWTFAMQEDKQRLANLAACGSRLEYIQYARSLKYYGYTHFAPCEADYPEKGSRISMAAGEREFSIRIQTDSEKVMEGNFKVQRIRSWKLTSMEVDDAPSRAADGLQFAFEYLFSKGDLRWITIYSSQAILMSMIMQGMIDEILREQQGKQIKTPKGKVKRSRSLPEKSTPPGQSSPKRQMSTVASIQKERVNGVNSSPTVKPSTGKPQGIIGKKSTGVNEVFEDIGDDDL